MCQTFQSYQQFKEIPRKLVVAKRLAQCLNPALPNGVHQRALDVYSHILAVLGVRSRCSLRLLFAVHWSPCSQKDCSAIWPCGHLDCFPSSNMLRPRSNLPFSTSSTLITYLYKLAFALSRSHLYLRCSLDWKRRRENITTRCAMHCVYGSRKYEHWYRFSPSWIVWLARCPSPFSSRTFGSPSSQHRGLGDLH